LSLVLPACLGRAKTLAWCVCVCSFASRSRQVSAPTKDRRGSAPIPRPSSRPPTGSFPSSNCSLPRQEQQAARSQPARRILDPSGTYLRYTSDLRCARASSARKFNKGSTRDPTTATAAVATQQAAATTDNNNVPSLRVLPVRLVPARRLGRYSSGAAAAAAAGSASASRSRRLLRRTSDAVGPHEGSRTYEVRRRNRHVVVRRTRGRGR
jgi:hypothetical protein